MILNMTTTQACIVRDALRRHVRVMGRDHPDSGQIEGLLEQLDLELMRDGSLDVWPPIEFSTEAPRVRIADGSQLLFPFMYEDQHPPVGVVSDPDIIPELR